MRKLIPAILAVALSFGISSIARADLNDGLVAYYPFNGNANDISGNGNHGTEYGGVSYVEGVVGQALSFDGVDDYVDIWSMEEINNNVNTTEGTVSMWIKPNQNAGHIYQYFSAHNDRLYLRVNSSNDSLCFQVGNGGMYSVNEVTFDNTWYHIVGVWSPDGMKLYFNGELDSTADFPNPGFTFQGNETFYLGRRWLKDWYYNGVIDEMRIYDRALSKAEIRALAGKNYESDLVAYYSFNDESDPGHDDSGNGQQGELVGDAVWTAQGKVNGAMEFDGDRDWVVIPFSDKTDVNGWPEGRLALWFKVRDFHAERDNDSILFKSVEWGDHSGIAIGIRHKKVGGSWRNDETTNNRYSVTWEEPSLNQWYHAAVVYLGSSMEFYINGAKVGEDAEPDTYGPGDPNRNAPLRIGGQHPDGEMLNFDGWIDELRLYDRALTKHEIEALSKLWLIRLRQHPQFPPLLRPNGTLIMMGPIFANQSKPVQGLSKRLRAISTIRKPI